MIQVNLLPWRRVCLQQKLRFWLRNCLCFAGLLLVSTLMCAVFLVQQRALLQQHFIALKQTSQSLSLQQRRVNTASAQVKVLMEQRLISQQQLQRSRDCLQLLILLAEKIPEDVRLSELVEQQNHLILTGEGRFYHDILTFRETLAASNLLRDVSLTDVTQQHGQALNFVLKMQVRQPSDVVFQAEKDGLP